jgi:hypothetical protein
VSTKLRRFISAVLCAFAAVSLLAGCAAAWQIMTDLVPGRR